MRWNIFDIDGCIQTHQYPEGTDTKDLISDPPFNWVERHMKAAHVNVLVTGRGTNEYMRTNIWILRFFPEAVWKKTFYVGVDWDWQKMNWADYHLQKGSRVSLLLQAIWTLGRVMNIEPEICIYDDDKTILATVKKAHENLQSLDLKFYLAKEGSIKPYEG